MSDALLSIRALSLPLEYQATALGRWLAPGLAKLGNQEGFLPERQGIRAELRSFSMPAGNCYAICGSEGFVHKRFLGAVAGARDAAVESVQVTPSISSIAIRWESMTGRRTLIQFLRSIRCLDAGCRPPTDVGLERILLFADLLGQANLSMGKLSFHERVRCAITLGLFSSARLTLLDAQLFSCHEDFRSRVFERILLLKAGGQGFVMAAPDFGPVRAIAERQIVYRIQ
ncbi:hypothetical protein [Thiomonas sp. FB-6]|uniref:hypothetical protein n=1 Tax=Thiomonas sp. FB-6 TaxID=1158291 RepID=UPI00039ACAD6|nr:hypothetical protein [Thiomonas sp. FB-6]